MIVFSILLVLLTLLSLFGFIVGIVFWIVPDVNDIYANLADKGLTNSVFSADTFKIFGKLLLMLSIIFVLYFALIYGMIRLKYEEYIAPTTVASGLVTHIIDNFDLSEFLVKVTKSLEAKAIEAGTVQ
jgi:hypothetical protein